MSASLTSADIQHIAKLAKLILDTNETQLFTSQLSAILQFVSKLQDLPIGNVEQTAQVTGLHNVYREDEIDQSRILTQEQALANSKVTYNGFFVVKAVFSD